MVNKEFAPFMNIMAEWYSRDTSKKIRAVMKNKGESGEYLCTIPSYGFIKDVDDKKRWVVDEEAADVVRRIFNLCLEGYGPSQIARILENYKVLVPSAHWQEKDIPCPSKPPINPYRWVASTVSDILEKRDYLGHTVNFKTHKQSYKSKKKMHNSEDKQKVFEDTHEAIVDIDTWERAQELHRNKRRPTRTGDEYIFRHRPLCRLWCKTLLLHKQKL